ncbi:MAG: biotin-dependent carboxyltransferase family protein [Cellvibrionaceae bacterium]
MSLIVSKPGFLTLIQDYGRYGYQRIGVTNGGPLDEHAFLWANTLLGNHYNDAQLEISFGGFSATFKKDAMIALCGADLSATLNGNKISPWQSFYVKAGDEIAFASPVSGLRSYLAIKGGFSVAEQLSSCSTVVREKLGGLEKNGNKLQEKDLLDYSASEQEITKRVPAKFIPEYRKEVSLRFIPNFSAVSVGNKGHNLFIKRPYEVSQNIDRMGYRLSGEPIETDFTGIISQGISMGAIQVPKDGQPIVLMRDRQTMGGYPLVGCVAYLDLPLLAQSLPGTKVSFVPIDVDEAESELVLNKQFFNVPL